MATGISAPIGLYDSGVGGLSVVREVLNQLPHESILYLADTARVPYGGRLVGELIAFNREIQAYLVSEGVKAILVACNTSCATALEPLRDESPVPVLGLIEVGARAATTQGRNIAVLATEATVRSGAYLRAILAADPKAEVISVPCPQFVPLIERGMWDAPETRATVSATLAPLRNLGLDVAILGCSHYPFVNDLISDVLGSRVKLVNPAQAAVCQLVSLLGNQSLSASGIERPSKQIVVTGDAESFAVHAARALSTAAPAVHRIFLETLQLAGNRLSAGIGTRQAVPAI